MTAFLVLGGEATGTRAVTRLLIAGGCYGDGEHTQRLDIRVPHGLPHLVWRRSVPYASTWPSLADMRTKLVTAGYRNVHAVVTTRDWSATAQAQVAATHVTTVADAVRNLRLAYLHIFSQLAACALPYTIVSYESLAARPDMAPAQLLQELGLDATAPREQFYDGNAKWFPPRR